MPGVPVRSIIPSLKLGDYLSVQAHKPCSVSHYGLNMHVNPHFITKREAITAFHYDLCYGCFYRW